MSITSIKSPPTEPPYTRAATDALTHVASFLDYRDLARLSQADKRSKKVAQAVLLKRQKEIQIQLTSQYPPIESHRSDWCHRLRELFHDKRFQCLSFAQREEVLAGVSDDEFSLLCNWSMLCVTLTLQDIYKKLGASTRFRPLIQEALKEMKQFSRYSCTENLLSYSLSERVKLLWGIERLDLEHISGKVADEGWFGSELSLADATKVVEMIQQGWGGIKRIEIRGSHVSSEVFSKLQEAGVEVIAAPAISKRGKWVLAITAIILFLGVLALIISSPYLFFQPGHTRNAYQAISHMILIPFVALPILMYTPRCITWIRDKCFSNPLHHIPPHPRLNELSIPDSRVTIKV